jgi:integrase
MSGSQAAVAALVAGLQALGIDREHLATLVDAEGVPGITVSEFLPTVRETVSPASARTYSTYWRLLAELLGDREIAKVTVSEIEGVAKAAQERARLRRNERGGRSARENCVSAVRCFFERAKADGLRSDNPAREVAKPRRRPSPRRPLTDTEVAQLWDATLSGGDDPHLDRLLLRFHLETGARRGGALGLRLADLDAERQLVRLREKGDAVRWQPVSRTRMVALTTHASLRGASDPVDAVFRYLPLVPGVPGRPLSRRRYNTLTGRWQRELSWAAKEGVSAHWLRHTSTAAVERVAGYAVARRFAGHVGGEVTTTYITASIAELASAISILTGEPHPLLVSDGGVGPEAGAMPT